LVYILNILENIFELYSGFLVLQFFFHFCTADCRSKSLLVGGCTAAAAPPPFRPGNPALCGSRSLVTPCHCRLGDLLCFMFIVSLLYFFC